MFKFLVKVKKTFCQKNIVKVSKNSKHRSFNIFWSVYFLKKPLYQNETIWRFLVRPARIAKQTTDIIHRCPKHHQMR